MTCAIALQIFLYWGIQHGVIAATIVEIYHGVVN